MAYLRSRSFLMERDRTDSSDSSRAARTVSAAALWSRCAPPSGSGRILSTMPNFLRSGAVIFIISAAVSARAVSRQRMEAHPSGEMTE